MAIDNPVPFSARVRSTRSQLDAEFPDSARVGLLHLLVELIRRRYVEDWLEIAREAARIARVPPAQLTSKPSGDANQILLAMPWEKVYDFCERLHGYLAREVGYVDRDDNFEVTTSRGDAQAFISAELQRLFLEENLAFEFRDGMVYRRGRRHSVQQISGAELVMGDPRLTGARNHYQKALRFFRDPSKPDYENTVKEAVCAVEAAGKALFPEARAATLGDLTKWLTGSSALVPKALGQTLAGLYGFRSGGEGVGHGGTGGGEVTAVIAEYALAVAASQIILLVDIAKAQEPEVPF